MTVDDRTRLQLHRKLEAVLGPEEAETLMAHLPPVTWQDVATKDDVRAEGDLLRAEMAELRGELRTEMAELRGELRTEITGLRGEMHTEMAQLRGEMERGFAEVPGLIDRALAQQTRWMMMFICAWSTVVLGAARLLF